MTGYPPLFCLRQNVLLDICRCLDTKLQTSPEQQKTRKSCSVIVTLGPLCPRKVPFLGFTLQSFRMKAPWSVSRSGSSSHTNLQILEGPQKVEVEVLTAVAIFQVHHSIWSLRFPKEKPLFGDFSGWECTNIRLPPHRGLCDGGALHSGGDEYPILPIT